MKKQIILVSLLLSLVLPLCACTATAEKTEVNIAVLKGPTGMGAAYLMAQNDLGEAANQYTFTVAGAPDVLISQLITGELDMAALPTNTIALLYQRSEGAVQSLAVNTLGVLYLLERGDSVQSIEDLSGREIVSAGLGTTTEAVASRLFAKDAKVTYVSEHAEAVAQAVAGRYDLVLLPEPHVTSLLEKDVGFRIALNLTEEWEAASSTQLTMGGIAARREFAEENPEAVTAFLAEYAISVAYANDNPKEAAALIERYDIMTATIAELAIPRANMVCLTGGEMREALEAFYTALLNDNAELIGGTMPKADFYYAP